jgi:antibiotic biosynthesis monooxygenase
VLVCGGVVLVVVLHFRVPEQGGDLFRERILAAIGVLHSRPGFVAARLGRAADDANAWVLTAEWSTVGAWRRALSAYDVKMHVTPLLAEALDAPSVFEILASDDADGELSTAVSDRAADAETAGPGVRPVR